MTARERVVVIGSDQDTVLIDQLFLELSQFTNATTARELALIKERDILLGELARAKTALADERRRVWGQVEKQARHERDSNCDYYECLTRLIIWSHAKAQAGEEG